MDGLAREQQGFISKLNNVKRTKFFKPKDSDKEPMAIIFDQLNSHFNEADCAYLIDLGRCQRLIVSYTKQCKYDEAAEIIDLAKRALRSINNEARALGAVFVYPSFAYYASKKSNLPLAKRYINLVVKYDDMLTYKFPVLHLHKLHHILNLNQVFLANRDYKECGSLFIDVYTYLTTYKLKSKYGKGGEIYFDKMVPDFDLSQATSRFIDEYFLCVWENPEVEAYVLKCVIKEGLLEKIGPSDMYLNAWKDLCLIQTSLLTREPNLNLVLDFFNKYDFYLFDPFRLLILKSLYPLLREPRDKAGIIQIINEKLNFKRTDLLAKRVSHFKIVVNE